MRIYVRSFAPVLVIGAALLAAIPNAGARAAPSAPAPETVGRMKRIIIPDDGIPAAGVKPEKPPGRPARAVSSANSQAPVQSNPVPAQVPVQSMIDRAVRLNGSSPVVPSPLQ